MKSTGKKTCKDCDACKKICRWLGLSVIRDKEYFCTEKQQFTQKENSCERWQKMERVYDLSPQRFEKIKNDLEMIFSILSM